MKETIYLYVDRQKVQRMTKNLTQYKRGEIPVKLTVEVENEAFQPPVVEKHVFVESWKQGIDLEDVQFNENLITEEEAEHIRQQRIEKMKSILTEQGFSVTKEDLETDDE